MVNTFSRRDSGLILAAALLLLLLGGSMRALETGLNRTGATAAAPAGLSRVPARIGQWLGRESPLDEQVLRVADADETLHRIYTAGAAAPISAYVAHGVHTRDLLPHRPEVCYPAAGWVLERREPLTLNTPAGPAPATLLRFGRGGWDNRRIDVVHAYIAGGQVVADVDSLRGRIWRGSQHAGPITQIQISRDGSATGRRELEAFAAAFIDSVRATLSAEQRQ